jgi:hypothetical protein
MAQGIPKDSPVLTWLFNPFHYIAGGTALGIGLAVIVVAGVLASFTDSHFDGVLDFHSGLPAPFWLPALEGLINWVCMAVLLLAAGKVASKSRFRILDVFGTQALARWPGLLTAAATFIPGYYAQVRQLATLNFTIDPANAPGFITASVVIIAATVWMLVLMYRAYAVSCNVSGLRGFVSFVPALLVAEVLSKTALYYLLVALSVHIQA